MSKYKIRNIRAISTAPEGIPLTVVKVETDEPELYGLGCATFAYRWRAVELLVNDYLSPLLIGRDVSDIEDIWQTVNHNAYWRNGPAENNALSGVDMALWDIAGKRAGMPLYELLGGQSRIGARVYRHADGGSLEQVEENVLRFISEGVTHVRIQFGGYGGRQIKPFCERSRNGIYYDPDKYYRDTLNLFEYIRTKIGDEIELLHDTHERVPAIQAVQLAKALEKYRLFFLEDLLSPEQSDYFRLMRTQTTTPLAMGELFVNPKEWDYLIRERLIDFIRVHISEIGGITPARKLAVLCEAFGVRTAWHGPGDVSPVGHAANVHLDYTVPNFGIQEWAGISERLEQVFPGSPVYKNGFVYVSERPGLGVDINEAEAAKYPCSHNVTQWTQTRLPDGSAHTP